MTRSEIIEAIAEGVCDHIGHPGNLQALWADTCTKMAAVSDTELLEHYRDLFGTEPEFLTNQRPE